MGSRWARARAIHEQLNSLLNANLTRVRNQLENGN